MRLKLVLLLALLVVLVIATTEAGKKNKNRNNNNRSAGKNGKNGNSHRNGKNKHNGCKVMKCSECVEGKKKDCAKCHSGFQLVETGNVHTCVKAGLDCHDMHNCAKVASTVSLTWGPMEEQDLENEYTLENSIRVTHSPLVLVPPHGAKKHKNKNKNKDKNNGNTNESNEDETDNSNDKEKPGTRFSVIETPLFAVNLDHGSKGHQVQFLIAAKGKKATKDLVVELVGCGGQAECSGHGKHGHNEHNGDNEDSGDDNEDSGEENEDEDNDVSEGENEDSDGDNDEESEDENNQGRNKHGKKKKNKGKKNKNKKHKKKKQASATLNQEWSLGQTVTAKVHAKKITSPAGNADNKEVWHLQCNVTLHGETKANYALATYKIKNVKPMQTVGFKSEIHDTLTGMLTNGYMFMRRAEYMNASMTRPVDSTMTKKQINTVHFTKAREGKSAFAHDLTRAGYNATSGYFFLSTGDASTLGSESHNIYRNTSITVQRDNSVISIINT